MGGVYRICKSFEVESGHMLSKHPGRCRHPHGHTRRIEIVLRSDRLDDRDMVCDFHAIRLAVQELLDELDHAMAINSADPFRGAIEQASGRVVVFEDQDPTTEAMARRIYEHLAGVIAQRGALAAPDGRAWEIPAGVRVERVRVWETSSSWAEYSDA